MPLDARRCFSTFNRGCGAGSRAGQYETREQGPVTQCPAPLAATSVRQSGHRSGSLPLGVGKVKIDEGLRELALPASDFEAIRLELIAACVTLAQGLPLRDERAELFLEMFGASHGRNPSRFSRWASSRGGVHELAR
jgi:hypothetical protein